MCYYHTYLVLFLCLLQCYLIKLKVLYHSAEENEDMSINQLDDLIIEELIQPKEGGGRKLLKHAFKYFQILSEVKDLIEKQDAEGFDTLRNVTKCGPKWIKTKYEEDKLKEVYKWKTDDLKHLNATIESTFNIWNSFNLQLYSNLIDQLT